MKLSVSLILLALSFSFLTGQENILLSEFKQANKAYAEADYAKAIQSYESLLDQGVISDDLFANTGTAYLKNGEIGKAILNLEKALLINRNNTNAKLNLDLAKESIDNPITFIPDFILVTIWNSLVALTSIQGWIAAHLILLLVTITLIATKWSNFTFGPLESLKTWRGTYLLIFATIFISLFSLLMAFQRQVQLKGTNYGVVMVSGTVLTDGPDDRSNEISVITEGSRVLTLDRIDDWYKVQMDDKDEGWIKASNLELIKI